MKVHKQGHLFIVGRTRSVTVFYGGKISESTVRMVGKVVWWLQKLRGPPRAEGDNTRPLGKIQGFSDFRSGRNGGISIEKGEFAA